MENNQTYRRGVWSGGEGWREQRVSEVIGCGGVMVVALAMTMTALYRVPLVHSLFRAVFLQIFHGILSKHAYVAYHEVYRR